METVNCISNEDWIKYSKQILSAEAIVIIEAHVKVCPICEDIKAGIDLMGQNVSLEQSINEINRRVDQAIHKPYFSKRLVYWSAAATLVIGASLTIFLRESSNEPSLTIKPINANKKLEHQIPIHIQDSLNRSTQTKYATNETKAKFPVIEESFIVDKTESEDLQETEEVKHLTSEVLKFSDSRYLDTNLIKSIKDTLNRGNTLAIAAPSSSQMVTFSLIESDNLSNQNTQDDASKGGITRTRKKEIVEKASKQKASTKPSATSINSSHEFSVQHQDSMIILKARNYFTQKKYDKCGALLVKIIGNKSSIYYEESLLLSAKAKIELDKKEEAKQLLNKVIELNGKFKSEADSILKLTN